MRARRSEEEFAIGGTPEVARIRGPGDLRAGQSTDDASARRQRVVQTTGSWNVQGMRPLEVGSSARSVSAIARGL